MHLVHGFQCHFKSHSEYHNGFYCRISQVTSSVKVKLLVKNEILKEIRTPHPLNVSQCALRLT